MFTMHVVNKLNFVHVIKSLHLYNTHSVLRNQVCYLFCNKTLGLDEYMNRRKMTALQYKGIEDKFVEKMNEFANPNTNNLIFTEDLKHVIHLAAEKDVELVKNMIVKFSKQNNHLRFGNYIFGPVIMRFFHFLNKPVDALTIYNDESVNVLFDNLSSHLILTDLLFKNEMYEDIIQMYHVLRNKQLLSGKYPRGTMNYVFAAYYKLNTREHYERVKELWDEMIDSGATPMLRTILIVANMALKYGEPQFALDVVGASSKNNENIKTIKILAFLGQEKIEESIQLLQSVLLIDNPYRKKEMFNYDVVAKIKDFITKIDKKDLINKFNRVEHQLVTHGHINNETFEAYLFTKLSYDVKKSDEIVTATFLKQNRKRKFQPRMGLEDMI